MQARYYKPDTGRFLTLDPSAGDNKNPLTQNGYSYAENSPVIYIDPSGADAIWLENTGDVFGLGHTSLLIQNGSTWYYFYFGDTKTIFHSVPSSAMKSLSALNNYLKAHKENGYPYSESTYLKGNFKSSFFYCEYLFDRSRNGQWYNVASRNCTEASLTALSLVKGNTRLSNLCRVIKASPIPDVNNYIIRKYFGHSF